VRFGCLAVAPRDAQLRALLTRQQSLSPTFRWLGATARDERLPGYQYDEHSKLVGEGEVVWARAKAALAQWRPQRGAGLEVYPGEAAVDVGTTVLVVGRALGVAMIAACRVTQMTDEPNRFGFVYATLPVHPEVGEESFLVERGEDGVVRFELRVVSTLHDPIARLGGPVSRRLQRAATRRYLDAMQSV
jgi:uncharacterized protein (UPF0548 family)